MTFNSGLAEPPPAITAICPVIATTPPGPSRPIQAHVRPWAAGGLIAGDRALALTDLFAAAQSLETAAAALCAQEPNAVAAGRMAASELFEEPSPITTGEGKVRVLFASASSRCLLADSVANVVAALDDLNACLASTAHSFSPSLLRDCSSLVDECVAGLARLGVMTGLDDSGSVDQAALDRVAESSPALLESLFRGPGGLALRLRRLAKVVCVSTENLFAAMTPATPGLASLPARLVHLIGLTLPAGD